VSLYGLLNEGVRSWISGLRIAGSPPPSSNKTIKDGSLRPNT
jgi:hypothetical protein